MPPAAPPAAEDRGQQGQHALRSQALVDLVGHGARPFTISLGSMRATAARMLPAAVSGACQVRT